MKYKYLSLDRGTFYLSTIEAKSIEEAWEIVEAGRMSNLSTDMLLNEKQFKQLQDLIK